MKVTTKSAGSAQVIGQIDKTIAMSKTVNNEILNKALAMSVLCQALDS